jgi:hypothetical protein
MDDPFDTKVAVVLLEDHPVWQKALRADRKTVDKVLDRLRPHS